MQKKQKILFLIALVSCALVVSSSASANYNWKDFFSFGQVKSIQNKVNGGVLNNIKNDNEWKSAIADASKTNGNIFKSDNVDTGSLYNGDGQTLIIGNGDDKIIYNGNMDMNGYRISDSEGTVKIGEAGLTAVAIGGNTTVDGGLTINRGTFAKWHLLLDSVTAGQQVHITDSSNVVAIGDGVDDTIKLNGSVSTAGDVAINGDASIIGGGLSVDGNQILNGDLVLDSSESKHAVDFSGASSMTIPRGSGAPVSTDCDDASEIGKMYIDAVSGGGMYVCTNKQASIGWDTVNLTD